MRVKVVCHCKLDVGTGVNVHFSPCYTGQENDDFFAGAPGGLVIFNGVTKSVADKFQNGKEYFMDFTPAK